MGFFGNLLGEELGGALGGLIGKGDLGRKIGGFGGGYLPFKKGGMVTAMKKGGAVKGKVKVKKQIDAKIKQLQKIKKAL